MAVSLTVCAGAPVPFDATEIDRKLAATHTLDKLATTANKVVFDLYDHCALVIRFYVVEGGIPRLIRVSGDRRLADARRTQRARAIVTGRMNSISLSNPAGFRLVAQPLHDGDVVIGVLEFVVPTEMVKPKQDRLALVARAASSALRAWRAASDAQHEAKRRAGTSFALGLRLAAVLARAGELGAATRESVQLLAKELKAPVVAWRMEPSGSSLRIGASSGLGASHRSALESSAEVVSNGDRSRTLLDLQARVAAALGTDATVVDGGSVVLVAGGRHPELEVCGRELSALLEGMPVSAVSSVEDRETWAPGDIERQRLEELTPREREILSLLAGGSGTRQIANRLVISEKTVKTHVQNILRKLVVTSRLEAAAVATRAGLVPLSAS